jgi:hypothetical protein
VELFHRTDADTAAAIRRAGAFVSRYPDGRVWFSNRREGQAEGYGGAVVVVNIPDALLELDDEFPDGEQHFTARAVDIAPEHISGALCE